MDEMRKVGDEFWKRDMLRGGRDGCVVRAEPDREDTDLGNVLLFMLFREALRRCECVSEKSLQCRVRIISMHKFT